LEWASKKGNVDIVKWLCTDERTKGMIHAGCPIGWAGYTGQVEIMRLLVSYGADPGKTDAVLLWSCTPPLMVAVQNGLLDVLKYLVDECKQDIRMLDRNGKDVLNHITMSTNWRELPGHVACRKWAKNLIGKPNKRN
jgi:ankyrin repeat protein